MPGIDETRSIVLQYYEAFNAGDLERLRGLMHDDIDYWVDARHIRGRDAAYDFISGLARTLSGVRAVPRVAAEGDGVVVCETRYENAGGDGGDDEGWVAAGGACDVFEVRDGSVIAMRNYYVPGPSDRTDAAPVPTQIDAWRLVDEHEALRRVATLVAEGAPEGELFAAVNEGIAKIVGADATSLFRFGPDDRVSLLAAHGRTGAEHPIGESRPLSPELREMRSTGLPLRIDVASEALPVSDAAQALAVRSSVGVPILVGGRVWGVTFASSTRPDPLPSDTEDRIARFTELVATAIANAESRAQLTASRARVVTAADATRRQIQRDLHDGAQQRLVQTVLTLELARDALVGTDPEGAELVVKALHHAERASAALRDLVRGIMPGALTHGGLRAGLEQLVSDLSIPVQLRVEVERLDPQVETTAYFVVAEALTNVVKHAQAGQARVDVLLDGDELVLRIVDDGVGGADPAGGSGLTGLLDRVAAADGVLRLSDAVNGGTHLEARLPVGVAHGLAARS